MNCWLLETKLTGCWFHWFYDQSLKRPTSQTRSSYFRSISKQNSSSIWNFHASFINKHNTIECILPWVLSIQSSNTIPFTTQKEQQVCEERKLYFAWKFQITFISFYQQLIYLNLNSANVQKMHTVTFSNSRESWVRQCEWGRFLKIKSRQLRLKFLTVTKIELKLKKSTSTS